MIDATCEITHRNGGFWYARVRYNRIIVYNSNFKSKESAIAHLAREIERRNALDGFRFKQPLAMPQSGKTPEDETPSTAFVSSNHLQCRNPEKRPKQA